MVTDKTSAGSNSGVTLGEGWRGISRLLGFGIVSGVVDADSLR